MCRKTQRSEIKEPSGPFKGLVCFVSDEDIGNYDKTMLMTEVEKK